MDPNRQNSFLNKFRIIAESLYGLNVAMVDNVFDILEKAKQDGKTVWLAGNGGSASTASHFANDLVKMCRIKAVALNDMVAMMTAYSNDEKAFNAFKHAEVLRSKGDVLVVFSCSGRSENIVTLARRWSVGDVVAFTGHNRKSPLVVDVKPKGVIWVENDNILVQESVHLAVCHALVSMLRL